MEKSIQTIGYITKEEDLQILDFNVLKGTTVLETFEPFPGYHKEIKQNDTPKSVFFILKTAIYREETLRIYKKLKDQLKFKFSLSISKIIINNQVYNALRTIDIGEYENVLKLQTELGQAGVSFYKAPIKGGQAIITTYKQFDLNEIVTDCYVSNRNKYFSYFIVPKKLSWDEFKDITMKIRNSWDFMSFDAALGIIYKNNEVFDIVRIFSNSQNKSDISSIKEKYLEKIKS